MIRGFARGANRGYPISPSIANYGGSSMPVPFQTQEAMSQTFSTTIDQNMLSGDLLSAIMRSGWASSPFGQSVMPSPVGSALRSAASIPNFTSPGATPRGYVGASHRYAQSRSME